MEGRRTALRIALVLTSVCLVHHRPLFAQNHPASNSARQSQGVPTPGAMALPPEAGSIRTEIETYLKELELASAHGQLDDCASLVPPVDQPLQEDPDRQALLLLRGASKAWVARSLSRVAEAFAMVEGGSLFERTGPGSRRLRFQEYRVVYVKLLYLYNEREVRVAHTEGSKETIRYCWFGLSTINPKAMAAVRAALDQAEKELRDAATIQSQH